MDQIETNRKNLILSSGPLRFARTRMGRAPRKNLTVFSNIIT